MASSEAFVFDDYPEEMFQKRVWHIARPKPESVLVARAAEWIRAASHPLIVARGGVIYREATDGMSLSGYGQRYGRTIRKGSLNRAGDDRQERVRNCL
jgi:TPP-dependent trihydroxycyclohexane-1,2-dione (THcHDO) dehydratase